MEMQIHALMSYLSTSYTSSHPSQVDTVASRLKNLLHDALSVSHLFFQMYHFPLPAVYKALTISHLLIQPPNHTDLSPGIKLNYCFTPAPVFHYNVGIYEFQDCHCHFYLCWHCLHHRGQDPTRERWSGEWAPLEYHWWVMETLGFLRTESKRPAECV